MSRARPAIQSIVLSCEHGGNKVPKRYTDLFCGAPEVLSSHRGFDPGALAFAKLISKKLKLPLHYSEITRLLIEMNRTLKSRSLFSEFSKGLPKDEKELLIKNYHAPYREKVESLLSTAKKPLLHLSIHTFTPELNGVKRDFDLGILYDPKIPLEKDLAYKIKSLLPKELKVKMNQPYKGTSDGLTKELRGRKGYAGIELEVNQNRVDDYNLQCSVIEALKEILK